jgi:hypothetical protein
VGVNATDARARRLFQSLAHPGNTFHNKLSTQSLLRCRPYCCSPHG